MIAKADLVIVGRRIDFTTPKGDRSRIDVQIERELKGDTKWNQIVVLNPVGGDLPYQKPYVFLLKATGRVQTRGEVRNDVYESVLGECGIRRVSNEDIPAVIWDEAAKREMLLDDFVRDYAVPSEFKRVVAFLQYMKNGLRENRWEESRLLTFVSRDGLKFYDVNHDDSFRGRPAEVGRRTYRELSLLLRQKNWWDKDRVSGMLVGLGSVYAQPYPQYSTLHYQPMTDGTAVTVTVGSAYRLIFYREDGDLKLAKLEYLTEENE